MPKRIPTPPPGDDEPKYLSVVHPYARDGYCNMELQQDRQDFARWVACCIDKDAFFAVFHKPSARDTVIIEVNRDYSDFDRILGEHRWSEFLRNPSCDEKDRATQVFYCTYHTGRMVQKNGWKRVYVNESWFASWSPNNSLIKYPYPAPHFCDVPVEDATNHPICRPLPGATKPPVPEVIAAPKPVVGSAAWSVARGPSATTAGIQSGTTPKGASKQQGVPKLVTPPVASVKKSAAVSQATTTQGRGSGIGGGPFVVKASNVWRTDTTPSTTLAAPPADCWDSSSSVSGRSTPACRTDSPASNPPATANQVPPGLPPKNAWSNGPSLQVRTLNNSVQSFASPTSTKSSASSVPNRVINSSADNYWSTSPPTSSPDTEPSCNNVPGNSDMVHVQISDSFEEEFYGMNIKEFGADHDDGLAELDSIAPGSWGAAPLTQPWPAADTSGWDDAPQDAESYWKESQKAPEKELCSVHGVLCKKGICQESAKKDWAKKRAEAEKEREAEKGKKDNRGKRPATRGALGRGGPLAATNAQSSPFRGSGAPVRTNWRGAPRAIVSPAAMEQRDAAARSEASPTSGWGDDDASDEPNADVKNPAADATSNDGWNVSEAGFDPWASSAALAMQTKGKGRGKGKNATNQKKSTPKKPMTWAEQMDAASAGENDDLSSVMSSKSSKRRGPKSEDAKSSTSGWGNVSEMHW